MLALVRVLDPGDDAQHGRFAGAVDADEGNVLALGELKGDAAKDLGGAEYLHQVGNGQESERKA